MVLSNTYKSYNDSCNLCDSDTAVVRTTESQGLGHRCDAGPALPLGRPVLLRMNGSGTSSLHGLLGGDVAGPTRPHGSSEAPVANVDQNRAAVERLKEQLTALDQRKERLMKSRPPVRHPREPLRTRVAIREPPVLLPLGHASLPVSCCVTNL